MFLETRTIIDVNGHQSHVAGRKKLIREIWEYLVVQFWHQPDNNDMEKIHPIPANSCIIHLLHAVIKLNYNESAVYLLYTTHLGEHFYVQTKDIQEF